MDDQDKAANKGRPKPASRSRRRVDPGESGERKFVDRASGRVAKGLADTDEPGPAGELLRLKAIHKKDGGESPREVTVQWVETEPDGGKS
ncbi:MAG: hypothetical protein FJW39_03790 [Acidobacteria bacterium]|nr:hypothetical protein [Acidobacteriota bacterium]